MRRVGVYTVCLNEQKFAKRWAETTKQADYVLVADTGSTDNTIRILEKHDVDVVPIKVFPWRFDDARNAALALMPSDLDVLISLDMDETLAPEWRQHLEASWTEATTRLKYQYVWSWHAFGAPDLVFYSDKIAGRFTHRWKHPVHEVLSPTVPEVISTCDPVLIEHHPDPRKSRGQYLTLLELSVLEDPNDDRNSHYLGREYFFYSHFDKAINELKRHLELPRASWRPERASSMRIIGKCHEASGRVVEAHDWFVRATLEDPNSREALIDVARFALKENDFHGAISYCQRALAVSPSVGEYMAERYARSEGAYDLMAVAFSHLGHHQDAVKFAKQACQLNPHDKRLADNLKMIRDKHGSAK